MKKIAGLLCAAVLSVCIFAGCSSSVGIVSIEKTSSNGLNDTYTITYTDGSVSAFTVTNGKDGEISVKDAYETYKEIYGDNLTYDEFLKKYLTVNDDGMTKAVNSSLLSSLKVACEFQVYSLTGGSIIGRPNYTLGPVVQQGSAVIYKMDEDYTYAITNYHVIYNDSAEDGKETKRAFVYVYGSENTPALNSSTSEYDYGSYAIPCEYIGGEISYDIALLKMSTAQLKKYNPDVKAVEIQSEFNVGETVYSVGNTEGMGIAVNSGVVSVDSEYITLKIDQTARAYRSIRMDVAIHEGNSGGGLFNAQGKMIGINNAGSTKTTGMNYAIPANIVTSVADNILYYYQGKGKSGVKKITMGLTVEGLNSRFVYDAASGYGTIKEDVSVKEVTENGIADNLGLCAGDRLSGVTINGVEYALNRFYELSELLLTVRANDSVAITYVRAEQIKTATYKVKAEDIKEI